MATITFRLSQKRNAVGQSEIMMRFRHGDIDLYTKCNVFVFPQQWDTKKQSLIVYNIREPKFKTPQTLDEYRKKLAENSESTKLQAILDEIKNRVITSFNATNKKSIGKDWLSKTVNPEKYIDAEVNLGFFETFQLYLDKHQFPYSTEKGFNVLIRTLKRYELFKAETDKKNKDFHLAFDDFSTDLIEDFESYIRNEHTLFKEYPKIFQKAIAICKEYKPHARGNNTISAMMRRLRLFFNWCNKQGHTANNPFERYEGKPEKYGTPFYITIDERNIIADFDLSKHPSLAIQRDIFIFQCCIGCRVSDLLNMTKDNVINDAIEYIPHKTKEERPLVVRVPLNGRAQSLITKYECYVGGKLFPFISAQKYNDAIKEIFTICGINRLVTVLNPITGQEEKKPLNEIASSHLARRTFVGNLYRQVKDPNLVGSLSGHVEGSKAFARYRNIDEDIKKELIKLID